MESEEKSSEKHWYVIHTYSGYENKVKVNLESRVHSMNMEDCIFRVVVPLEDETEIKDGKKKIVKRKVFPGYALVEMIVTDQSWYVVRNTPGVTGFVGSGTNPIPLSDEEVDRILQSADEEESKPVLANDIESGAAVRIINSGAFENFTGTVEEIDNEKGKLKVLGDTPGREIPIELGFDQVEKI
jgi:transcriptional antiterminator NusG